MKMKSTFAAALMGLATLMAVGCSDKDLAETVAPEKTARAEANTTIVNIDLEAGLDMPEDKSTRAGGLDMVYNEYEEGGKDKSFPYFVIRDDYQKENGDQKTIEAHCVFKPLKKGSDTELDDSRTLYGTLEFKRKPKSLPSVTDSGTGPQKLHCSGPVKLTGNAKIEEGDRWFVMGMVGGKKEADNKTITVKGLTGVFENWSFIRGVDSDPDGTAPFLSKWTELKPAPQNGQRPNWRGTMQFDFQGALFCVRVNNGTEYPLLMQMLALQSTELTTQVIYDLSSSNNINDTQEQVKWTNNEQKDAKGMWNLRFMDFSTKYFMNAKSSGKNFLYEPEESKSTPAANPERQVTIIFWTHFMPKALNNKPWRTGFFTSCLNRAAKPAWIETPNGDGTVTLTENTIRSKVYKYVLSCDPSLDDILSNNQSDHWGGNKHNDYANDIRMAPGMDFMCVKALQGQLGTKYKGKFVHLQLTVPQRPVMPIETMSQRNLYDYWGVADANVRWCPQPWEGNWSNAALKVSYVQEFQKHIRDKNTYWGIPTLLDWHGWLFQGHNNDNTHNLNVEGNDDWIEGAGNGGDKGLEEVNFPDGYTRTLYSVYRRLKHNEPNGNRIYALRFFKGPDKKEGSQYFCLQRYTYEKPIPDNTVRKDKMIVVDAVWLGPEYAKLYKGMYDNIKEWIDEIAYNDNNRYQSIFNHLRRDMVTRYLETANPYKGTTYRNRTPTGFNSVNVGYFYGPTDNYNVIRAKGIAIQYGRVMTGPSHDQRYDFTDFFTNGETQAYLRPIRRKLTKFETVR